MNFMKNVYLTRLVCYEYVSLFTSSAITLAFLLSKELCEYNYKKIIRIHYDATL